MSTKTEQEFTRQVAIHEIGHALLYHRYDLEFQLISIIPGELNYGYVRPAYDNTMLWIALVHHYFVRPETSKMIKTLEKTLKEHIEICVTGKLASLYYEFRDKTLALNEFNVFYEDYIVEMSCQDVIEDLIVFYKIPDPLNRRKKIKMFGMINHGMFFKSDEYSDIDGDLLESYLALSLYYRRDEKRIISYYKRTAKRVLDHIESQFHLIEQIAKVLLRKKKLSYKQFEKLYKEFTVSQA